MLHVAHKYCMLICVIGDTKAGTLIGVDNFGNKYFENNAEELPRENPGLHQVQRNIEFT